MMRLHGQSGKRWGSADIFLPRVFSKCGRPNISL